MSDGTTPSGSMPSGKITQFDKSQYDRLIKFVDGWHQNATKRMTNDDLDVNDSQPFAAGSEDWPPASKLMATLHSYAGGVHKGTKDFADSIDKLVHDLQGTRDAFDDTNDLATFEASKFQLGSGGTSSGGSDGTSSQ